MDISTGIQEDLHNFGKLGVPCRKVQGSRTVLVIGRDVGACPETCPHILDIR